MPGRRGASAPIAFDREACERLLTQVRSTAEPGWKQLAELLWPVLTRLIRQSRGMTVLARSEDHLRNATLLVLEKLGKDGCRAAQLYAPWRDAQRDKTLDDWLRIVTTNVIRDYVREQTGRGAGKKATKRSEAEAPASSGAEPVSKRQLHSLATLLPDDDDLGPVDALSATSVLAARELLTVAASKLPADQLAALSSWLRGTTFEEMSEELSISDAVAAKKLVRAAIAMLRRHALAA